MIIIFYFIFRHKINIRKLREKNYNGWHDICFIEWESCSTESDYQNPKNIGMYSSILFPHYKSVIIFSLIKLIINWPVYIKIYKLIDKY